MENDDQSDPGRGSGFASSVPDWFRSLRRSSSDRMLTGVAGGLAVRTGVPSLVVRAAFVLSAFAGFGIPLYLLAWVLVPTDRGQRITDGGGLRDWLAVGIVVVAGLMLTTQLAGFSTAELIWRSFPWALMLVGVALITRRREAGPTGTEVADHEASHSRTGEAPYGVGQADRQAETETGQSAVPPGGTSRGVLDGQSRGPGQIKGSSRLRPPSFPVVGLLTWCAVLVVCSILGVMHLAGLIHIGPGVFGAVALTVFGAGLVYSAFRGRARGLILPALALAVVFGSLGAIDLRLDNVDGPFRLEVADAAELPSHLRTSISESSLDLGQLELPSDRFLRVDQTGGSLDVILPARVNVALDVRIGVGNGSITKPSRGSAVTADTRIAREWLDHGVPAAGEEILPSLYSGRSGGGPARLGQWWGSNVNFASGVNTRDQRLVDQGSEHTLELEIHMGVGSVRIIDPRWSDESAPKLTAPAQLCTVGGERRGVVKACGDVPKEKRVALCINESQYLVDCREDRPATPDYPRVAACRGYFGEEVDCQDVRIEPLGAELSTPGITDSGGEADPTDVEPGRGPDPTSPPDTIRMPDLPTGSQTRPTTSIVGG